MTTATLDLASLPEAVGKHLGYTDWRVMTQERVNEFADATDDHQFIHVDVERAKQTPFGGTIAHGYFTLSLAPRFSYDMFSFEGFAFGLNYGLNRVRFPSPLPVGSKIRATVEIAAVEEVPDGVQVTYRVTVVAEGAAKPCCVADILFRYYTSAP